MDAGFVQPPNLPNLFLSFVSGSIGRKVPLRTYTRARVYVRARSGWRGWTVGRSQYPCGFQPSNLAIRRLDG